VRRPVRCSTRPQVGADRHGERLDVHVVIV
jgi:hypothetical protein